MERSANQKISQEDFIKSWTDMEQKLRDKIERNHKEIRECQLAVTENVG